LDSALNQLHGRASKNIAVVLKTNFPKINRQKKVFKIQNLKKKYTVFILTQFTVQDSNNEQEQKHPPMIVFRYLSLFRTQLWPGWFSLAVSSNSDSKSFHCSSLSSLL